MGDTTARLEVAPRPKTVANLAFPIKGALQKLLAAVGADPRPRRTDTHINTATESSAHALANITPDPSRGAASSSSRM